MLTLPEIHWQREEVKFDGEIRKAARLVAVVGDPGTSYRY